MKQLQKENERLREELQQEKKDFKEANDYCFELKDYKSRINKAIEYVKNEFKRIQFRSGTDIPNKTRIYIKSAFESFYKDKEGKAVFYPVVLEYSTVEETIEKAKEEVDSFKNFSEEIQITSEDLPF